MVLGIWNQKRKELIHNRTSAQGLGDNMQSVTFAAKVALATLPAALYILAVRYYHAALEISLQRAAELAGSKNRHPAGKGRF